MNEIQSKSSEFVQMKCSGMTHKCKRYKRKYYKNVVMTLGVWLSYGIWQEEEEEEMVKKFLSLNLKWNPIKKEWMCKA